MKTLEINKEDLEPIKDLLVNQSLRVLDRIWNQVSIRYVYDPIWGQVRIPVRNQVWNVVWNQVQTPIQFLLESNK